MAPRISIGLGIAGGLLATRILIGFASSLNPTFARVPQAARDLIHSFSASSMRVCQLLPVDLKKSRVSGDSRIDTAFITLGRCKKACKVYKSLADYVRENPERNAAIVAAYRSGGYTLRDIGDFFGLHYSRISKIIQAADSARQEAKGKT